MTDTCMKVNVKTTNGTKKTYVIDIKPLDTILGLKQYIEKLSGIPINRIKLFHLTNGHEKKVPGDIIYPNDLVGRVTFDEKTLLSSDVQDGSIFYLCIKN